MKSRHSLVLGLRYSIRTATLDEILTVYNLLPQGRLKYYNRLVTGKFTKINVELNIYSLSEVLNIIGGM